MKDFLTLNCSGAVLAATTRGPYSVFLNRLQLIGGIAQLEAVVMLEDFRVETSSDPSAALSLSRTRWVLVNIMPGQPALMASQHH